MDAYNMVKSKPIADKLKTFNTEEVFKYYVHDFVMYCTGSSEENEDTKV